VRLEFPGKKSKAPFNASPFGQSMVRSKKTANGKLIVTFYPDRRWGLNREGAPAKDSNPERDNICTFLSIFCLTMG